MFGTSETYSAEEVNALLQEERQYAREQAELTVKKKHELEIKEVEQECDAKVRELKHKLENAENDKIKELQAEVHELEKENQKLKTKVEMLDGITDVNGDVIEVQNLVEQLIEKLPEINLESLTVNNSSDASDSNSS